MMRTKFGKLRLNRKKTALRQGDVSKALELSSGRWGLAKHPKNAEGRPKEFEGMHKVAATGTKKFYVSPTYYRIFHKRLTSASPAAMERLVRGGKPLGRSRLDRRQRKELYGFLPEEPYYTKEEARKELAKDEVVRARLQAIGVKKMPLTKRGRRKLLEKRISEERDKEVVLHRFEFLGKQIQLINEIKKQYEGLGMPLSDRMVTDMHGKSVEELQAMRDILKKRETPAGEAVRIADEFEPGRRERLVIKRNILMQPALERADIIGRIIDARAKLDQHLSNQDIADMFDVKLDQLRQSMQVVEARAAGKETVAKGTPQYARLMKEKVTLLTQIRGMYSQIKQPFTARDMEFLSKKNVEGLKKVKKALARRLPEVLEEQRKAEEEAEPEIVKQFKKEKRMKESMEKDALVGQAVDAYILGNKPISNQDLERLHSMTPAQLKKEIQAARTVEASSVEREVKIDIYRDITNLRWELGMAQLSEEDIGLLADANPEQLKAVRDALLQVKAENEEARKEGLLNMVMRSRSLPTPDEINAMGAEKLRKTVVEFRLLKQGQAERRTPPELAQILRNAFIKRRVEAGGQMPAAEALAAEARTPTTGEVSRFAASRGIRDKRGEPMLTQGWIETAKPRALKDAVFGLRLLPKEVAGSLDRNQLKEVLIRVMRKTSEKK